MQIRTLWYFLIVFLQYQHSISSDGFNSCCADWQKNGWYDVRHSYADSFLAYSSVCSVSTPVTEFHNAGLSIRLVNFQPKNQFGILGLSFCESSQFYSFENCYVAEIFGLVSGRLGYFWRKHSQNETGEERLVPGSFYKLPSTLLKSDVEVANGTWDPEGKTIYQFYVESQKIGSDYSIVIRYNGGTAKQQEEMTFNVPLDASSLFFYSASYLPHGNIVKEDLSGCSNTKRMQLKPGQDFYLQYFWHEHTTGISFCTDVGQNDCYVLEIYLMGNTSYGYTWKRRYFFEQAPEDGRSTKHKVTVLAQGESVPNVDYVDKFTRELDERYKQSDLGNVSTEGANASFNTINENLHLRTFLDTQFVITKTFDEKLVFEYPELHRPTLFLANNVTFDLPDEFQYVTLQTRLNLSKVNVAEAIPFITKRPTEAYGPCHNGRTLGYISDTCKHQITLNPTSWSKNKEFSIFSPRPGRAEAELVSGILESKAVRKYLCVSLLGIASPQGASISVTVEDASGKSNETVDIGELAYNKVYPPEWQRVRLSANLPISMQSAPLLIKLKSKRPTADSVVLVSEAKLCSYDGCGLPTAEATPFIAYGVNTSAAKYPWHVAIFKAEDKRRFKFICGGTLIRSDAVLSAAHCFVNDQNKFEHKSKFKLAVGKKYNSLLQFEPNQQYSDALDIKVSSKYTGPLGNYANDIALIRVRFEISSLVLPVCLNWFKTLPTLEDGDIGEIAGWGEHERGYTSRELFFARFPFIPYDQCISTVPETFIAHVTHDKFCAGNVNGSTVKKGDSGGGLVFNTGGLWYLRGIVSTGVPEQLTYSTFTDVVQFIPWIKKNLNISDFD